VSFGPAQGDGGGGSSSGGKLVQEVRASTTSVVACTAAIPHDDTIPQNTEGTEVLTVSITPTSVSNKLVIEFVGSGHTASNYLASTALFKDSDASAIAASQSHSTGVSMAAPLVLRHYMDAPSTSAITFKIRCGATIGNGLYVNGDFSGNRRYGGVAATTLIVREVSP